MSAVPPVFRVACKRAFGADEVDVTVLTKKPKVVDDIAGDETFSLSCDELLERLWALDEARVHIHAILYLLQDKGCDGRSVATSHLGVSDTLNRKYLRESVGSEAFLVLESTYLQLTSIVVKQLECSPEALRIRIKAITHELGVFMGVVSDRMSEIKARLGPVVEQRRPRTHYESMYA